jgi:hypothetical protein
VFALNDADRELAERIIANLYMDDLVRTFNEESEAIKENEFAVKGLLDAKFPLRAISSNSQVVWDYFTENHPEHAAPKSGKPESRVLGTLYAFEEDYLRPDVAALQKVTSSKVPYLTPRLVLRAHSLVFDPLGLIEHWHFIAKRLMQDTWHLKLKWDDQLPKSIEGEWFVWINSYVHMLSVKVPRCVAPINHEETTYHVFVDASEVGYAACIYVVHENVSYLLCSRARVVPKKMLEKGPGISIPRVELLGAELGTRLWDRVKTAQSITGSNPTFWSDSQTALWWIKTMNSRYKIFVTNRVNKIRQVSAPTQWRFVPGKQNPADLATRGLPAVEAAHNQQWFHGPSWLPQPDLWPAAVDMELPPTEATQEISVLAMFDLPQGRAAFEDEMMSTTKALRSLNKLAKIWLCVAKMRGKKLANGPLRTITDSLVPSRLWKENKRQELVAAYKARIQGEKRQFTFADRSKFLQELRDAADPGADFMHGIQMINMLSNTRSINASIHYMLESTQTHYFPGLADATLLSYNDRLELPDKLKCPIIQLGLGINPRTGLLCSYGRVSANSRKDARRLLNHPDTTLPDVTRELILIPPTGVVAECLMYGMHLLSNHGGQLAMTYLTRDKYWVIQASKVAKRVKRHCNLCNLYALRPLNTEPTALPFERFTPAYPFQFVGLDYAQLTFDYTITSNKKMLIICIFTCMVTRAVHFELAMDMSGPEFARVFETFCNSRTVVPQTVVSDNGKNFLPIAKEMQKMWEASIDSKFRSIKWKWIPRHAPNWGGFYERLIGVFKKRFIKEFPKMIFGNLLEAQSAVKRIESRMNRRPLWAVTMDKDEPSVITPADFLVVTPSDSFGQPTGELIENLPKLHELQRKHVDKLWHEFFLSYLSALRVQHKWNKRAVPNLKVGDMVMLEDERNKVRTKWPIGVIRSIIYDTRSKAAKAAYVDQYFPNLVNTKLKNKLYGVRIAAKNLSIEQRVRVTGCYKPAKLATPITRLYPYEMWEQAPKSLSLDDAEPPAKKTKISDEKSEKPVKPTSYFDQEEIDDGKMQKDDSDYDD